MSDKGNSNGETHEVGQRRPNAWGLYDMLGNVDEWCLDDLRAYTENAVVDPIGPMGPTAFFWFTARAMRGGSWASPARLVRAAYRGASHPVNKYAFYGFRCASSGPSK
jgi:formylglycine-generating enzyme required for sulfatase activity